MKRFHTFVSLTRKVAPLAILLGLLTPAIAQAHTVLISSTPAAGSTIPALPESITLTFANPLLTLGSAGVNQVQVTDPMNEVITSSHNVVHGAVLSNVLSPSMVMSGIYHVAFRVAAQDGHILNGSFIFSVGAPSKPVAVKVPTSGVVTLHANADGKGVFDGVGSPTDTASGTFTINFSNDTFCYLIRTTITDVTAAHVHAASQKNMTISDEIFLPLELSSINSPTPICQKEDGVALEELVSHANSYVFMLHTKRYPDGDVAGLLDAQTIIEPAITGATLTAATKNGDSAITLSLHNPLSENVLLQSVSSSIASGSMIFYDSNMCQGNTTMKPLANILVGAQQSQSLGYKYQGAMLSGLKQPLVVGSSVTLTLTWSENGASMHTESFIARVVAPPKGLHFDNSAMSPMSGM